jgi:hypothetical protein
MVELVGVITISALVSLLTWSMAGESRAEGKKLLKVNEPPHSGLDGETPKGKSFKLAA